MFAIKIQNDSFGCNSRSELTSATLGNAAYAYAFDYIGNRATASEAGTQLAYAANALNQYATITETEAFTPTYDADGNATLVKTATGTWSVSCNGENRPVRFENAGTQTVVECGYDSLGRRVEKKVTVAGTLVSHERYAYRGYLQIAAFDVAGTQTPTLKRVIYWDPTEETATRPLAISIVGDNVYFPTVDLTKNVCELVDFYGNVAATYDYAPFGNVSAGTPSGTAVPANSLQWSSEIYDSELDLVYYNYRHYSPSLGRFLSRDPIQEQGGLNLYAFCKNRFSSIDFYGLKIEINLPKYETIPIEQGVSKSWFQAEFRVSFTAATINIGANKEFVVMGNLPSMVIKYNKKFFNSIEELKKSHAYKSHEKQHFDDFVKHYTFYAKSINAYDGKKCPICLKYLENYNKLLYLQLKKKLKESEMFFHYEDYSVDDILREYNVIKPIGEPNIKRRYGEQDRVFYGRIYEAYRDIIDGYSEEIRVIDSSIINAKKELDKCIKK